jgi:hypothetical protein
MASVSPLRAGHVLLMEGMASASRVIIVRPAESAAIVARRETGDQAQTASGELTDVGHEQARLIAAAVEDRAWARTQSMEKAGVDWRTRHLKVRAVRPFDRTEQTARAIVAHMTRTSDASERHRIILDSADYKLVLHDSDEVRVDRLAPAPDQDPLDMTVYVLVASTSEYLRLCEALLGLPSLSCDKLQLAPAVGSVTFMDLVRDPQVPQRPRVLVHELAAHTLPDSLCWNNALKARAPGAGDAATTKPLASANADVDMGATAQAAQH